MAARRKKGRRKAGRRKGTSRKKRSASRTRRTNKKARSKRRTKGKVPLDILEKRLKRLNGIVKSRGGRSIK